MNLINTTRLTPLRDEKGSIYKWEEEEIVIAPPNLQSASYKPEIKQVVITLTNGQQTIIADTLKSLQAKYVEATNIEFAIEPIQLKTASPIWFYIAGMVVGITLTYLSLWVTK